MLCSEARYRAAAAAAAVAASAFAAAAVSALFELSLLAGAFFAEEELEVVNKIIIERMVNATQLAVPLIVDTDIGINWDEAH